MGRLYSSFFSNSGHLHFHYQNENTGVLFECRKRGEGWGCCHVKKEGRRTYPHNPCFVSSFPDFQIAQHAKSKHRRPFSNRCFTHVLYCSTLLARKARPMTPRLFLQPASGKMDDLYPHKHSRCNKRDLVGDKDNGYP